MAFEHEQLNVYRVAIEYVGWAYRLCEHLRGHGNAKDHLLRASQAVPPEPAFLTRLCSEKPKCRVDIRRATENERKRT